MKTAKMNSIANQFVNRPVWLACPYTSTRNLLQELYDCFMGTAMKRPVGRLCWTFLVPIVTELPTEQKVGLLFPLFIIRFQRRN